MDATMGVRLDHPERFALASHGYRRASRASRCRGEAVGGKPGDGSGPARPATGGPLVAMRYAPRTSRVLIYDFLMPLTHEAPLRKTLDDLCFRDKLVARLRALRSDELEEVFPRAPKQGDWHHLERILDFMQERFVGYSVTHVSGRSRFGPLLSQERASEFETQGARYLMDETTAVTRFVFPYADDRELAKIRYLFGALFVRSIIEDVKDGEQIRLIESSSQNRVHVWSAFDRCP